MKFKIFRLSLLILSCLSLQGQEFNYRQIVLPAEVKASELAGLHIDLEGFIWLHAGRELFRFNGSSFKAIQPDSNSVSEDEISALYHDRDGQLWVGWKSGALSWVIGDQMQTYQARGASLEAPVVKWVEDGQGHLWMATYGEGVFVKDSNDHWQHFDEDDGLPATEIYDMERWGHYIMLATDQGLLQLSYRNQELELKVLGPQQGLADQIVKSIAVDKEGLWIAYYETAIDLLQHDGSLQHFDGPEVLDAHKLVRAGNLSWWLSESGNLYQAKNNAGWQLINLFEGRRAQIQDVIEDNEGHLWIAGTLGLVMLDQWRELYHEDKRISALYKNGDSLYYASEGKLYRMNLLSRDDQLLWEGDEPVLSLYVDNRERVWAGTFNAGVKIYDEKEGKLKVLNEQSGLVNNNVLSINGNEKGIWLGTLGGASFYEIDDSDFKKPLNYGGKGGVGLQYIYAVALSDKGQVYLATDGDGVLRQSKEQFSPLAGAKAKGVVFDLCTDRDGKLWWIDPNGGLMSWEEGGQVDTIAVSQSENGKFAGIEAAPNGDILVFYESGILRWSPQHETWMNYGKSHGLENLQPELHAQYLDEQGGLYIGSAHGINFLNLPLLPELAEPNTFFEGVELYFSPVQLKSFRYRDNHLTFKYVGRWFTDPQAVSYRIKLEGYDLEWTTSQNTQSTYPRLPPGDYSFKVVAGVDGHYPQEQMKEYRFRIATPWYQRWYTIVVVIVILAGLIALYIQARLRRLQYRQQQEQDRIRAQYEAIKSQVNPHFLFNSFNTLMALIEDDREEARDYLSDLSDFFRNILQYREVDLYSLKEELNIISTYLNLQEKRFGENIQVDICLSEEDRQSKIPPLSLQLLLENAFKHNVISRSRPLRAKIYVEDGYLVVWNALRERQNAEASTGYGLESIRKKYAFYSKKPVKIKRDQQQYAVYLPILT